MQKWPKYIVLGLLIYTRRH